ncbi:MAG: hypothetical protein KDA84_12620 [Planctomycetaceae bacterium]|nr:hypothetical protein [Planctomycetaceae bacterium]
MKHLILCLTLFLPVTAHAQYTGLIANETAAATMQKKEKEKVPRSKCNVCKGTGKVKAGDGVTIVERECDNCYDDKKATKEKCTGPVCDCKDCNCKDCGRELRILFFTANWCGPCWQVKNNVLPIMKLNGWTYGEGRDNHIQLIDVDKHPEVAKQFDVSAYPTFILIKEGKPVKGGTRLGYQPAASIADLYNKAVPK